MPYLKTFPILFATLVALVGCVRPGAVWTADIDPQGWGVRDTLRFEVDNRDTVSMRDICVLFRFDGTFAEQKIPLAVRVTTPDSLCYEENFTAVLGDRIKANNDFYEAVAPYRSNAVLSQRGIYIFEVVNAGEELGGLWGAGIMTE